MPPTSPVKTRIPLTSLGHLITEVKKQLFGVEAPASVDLNGWRKFFNSYTMRGRRNCVLATYGLVGLTLVSYVTLRRSEDETASSSS